MTLPTLWDRMEQMKKKNHEVTFGPKTCLTIADVTTQLPAFAFEK